MPVELATDLATLALYDVVIFAGAPRHFASITAAVLGTPPCQLAEQLLLLSEGLLSPLKILFVKAT